MADTDWDRTVFALIGPDAVARHLAPVVLERTGFAGFVPLAWRVLWHRPADLDAFHEVNIAHSWQAYRYRLVDQLFAFGPAVALLLADQRPAAGPAGHRRLKQAKGSSDPARSGPGTIRGDLGSINAMLSLLHTADSAADSAAESAIFTGPGGFASGDTGELHTLLAMLQLSAPREGRGYRDVLAGLRAKALAAAWDDLPRPVRKTASAMLAAGPAEFAGPGGGERLAALRPAEFAAPGGGERLAALLPDAHPLAGLLRADFTPQSPGPDPERAAAALAPFGTGIDAWESLVLATSRRFWPRGTRPGGPP